MIRLADAISKTNPVFGCVLAGQKEDAPMAATERR